MSVGYKDEEANSLLKVILKLFNAIVLLSYGLNSSSFIKTSITLSSLVL